MSTFEDWLHANTAISSDDPGLRYAALLGAMLFARERGFDEALEDRYLEVLDGVWKEMTEADRLTADRMLQDYWTTTAPSLLVVKSRQDSEGQPPRFWAKDAKEKNGERRIVEMRVVDDVIYTRRPVIGWTKIDPTEWSDTLWAGCFPPLDPADKKISKP